MSRAPPPCPPPPRSPWRLPSTLARVDSLLSEENRRLVTGTLEGLNENVQRAKELGIDLKGILKAAAKEEPAAEAPPAKRIVTSQKVMRAGGKHADLDDVGSTAHLEDRVGSLSIAQKHLLELAKALVMKPKVLILVEPTAPLGQASVELLFERVRTAAFPRRLLLRRQAWVLVDAESRGRADRRPRRRNGWRHHTRRRPGRPRMRRAGWTPLPSRSRRSQS